MNPKYQPLFEPLPLNNGVELKNRLVVAPLTLWASNPDGTTSGAECHFLKDRAKDFGLFIYSGTLVSPNGKTFIGQPSAYKPEELAGLKSIAQTIQAQGAKAILQLQHGGAKAVADLVDEVVAPSAYLPNVRALQAVEIEQIIADFAYSTTLAIQAGFDGVEINGANGFLLQQFYSPHSNQRTDKWGEKAAFPLAVIQAVHQAIQAAERPDFILGYRLSPEEEQDDGITMAETLALVEQLAHQPLQYLHLSLWEFDKRVRRGADPNKMRIALVHQQLNGRLPLIGVGGLLTADDVLKAYQTGYAELIAVGKAVMINPNFAQLIAQGKTQQIETELDLSTSEKYRIPEHLWQMCHKGISWLPKVKTSENG